jgi:hypothetical protein
MATLRVRIKGEPETIAFHGLLAAGRHILNILADLDTAFSHERRGSLDWVTSDLEWGSIVFAITSRSMRDDMNVGPEVVRTFVVGLSQLEREGTTPPYLSETGLHEASRLVKLIGRQGIAGFVISGLSESVEISARAAANVDQLLRARYRTIGSVEGRLEMVSIHRRPRFTVYHSRTNKAVRCDFASEDLSTVTAALGRRVVVSGVVHSNAKGEPLRVDVERVAILGREEDLPSTASLAGSDPSFTHGMSTEEYIRSIRGA